MKWNEWDDWLLLCVRAPNCLVEVHVENSILLKFAYHWNNYLAFMVSKGTEIPIFAFLVIFFVRFAKFGFVS